MIAYPQFHIGATSNAAREDDCLRVSYMDARVWRVQRRIIACYAAFFQLSPNTHEEQVQIAPKAGLPKSSIKNLQWLASHSGHELQRNGHLWFCIHCQRSTRRTGLSKLARSPCNAIERRLPTHERHKSPPRTGGRTKWWRPSDRYVRKHAIKQELRAPRNYPHSIDGRLGIGHT